MRSDDSPAFEPTAEPPSTSVGGASEQIAYPQSRLVLFHLMLAVGEAANNAIEHAYVGPGNVVLRAQLFAHATIVEIVDFGSWRPLRAMDDRARPRGHGLAMMGAAVPDMRIHRSSGGTRVRFALERPT